MAENPAAEVGRPAQRYDAGRFEFYRPEEVWALVRAAASEQDGAVFLTAASTGLRRGELLALRWRESTSRARRSVSTGACPSAS